MIKPGSGLGGKKRRLLLAGLLVAGAAGGATLVRTGAEPDDPPFSFVDANGALFVHQDEQRIHSLADPSVKTIAIMKGDNAEEYVLRKNLSDRGARTSTFEEAFQMLSTDKVDAGIDWNNFRRALWIIGGGLVSTAAAILWLWVIHLLRRQIHKKTADLRAANRELDEARTTALNMMQNAVQAKENIAASEAQFRSYIEHAPHGIFIIDRHGRHIDVNPAASRISGFSRDELLSMGIPDLWPEKGREEDEQHFNQLMETGQMNGEFQVVTRSGETRWWSLSAVKLSDNRYLGFTEDITERIAFETALKDSRARFATLLSNLPGMAYRCRNDRQWTMEFISDGCLPLTGYTPEELLENTKTAYADLIHPDERERVWDTVQTALRTGDHFEIEYRIIKKDGTERWVWERGVERMSERSETRVLDGFVSDITADRIFREAMQKSEERLRNISAEQSLILNNSTLGIALVRRRVFEWVNPRLAEMFNRTVDQVQGQPTRIIYPSEEDYKHLEDAYEALGRAERYDHAVRFTHADGSLFWCRLIGKAVDPDRPNDGSIWMIEDITDRKNKEEELQRLSTAIEQSQETVMITDMNGAIQYVNPAFEAVSGYSRAEAVGQNPRILKSGKQDPAFYRAMWETLKSGNTWEERMVNRRKDGSFYTEEASIAPVKSPGGEIINFVAVKRDITEELQKEEQFRQSQKMESVGQLAGGIAHDFNNILQAIQGFGEILLERLEAGSPEYDNVEEIIKSAKHATELTRKLLTFSRKQPVDKKRINLNDTIRDARILLHTLLGAKIDLRPRLADNLWPIHADHGQMTQIIMNLSVNARDAMPDGGRLTLTTENIRLADEDTNALPDVMPGPYICFSVTDTGDGIPPEVKEKLFEPFFTTKEVGKGTGLGLAVIYGIVKQNRGWIHVYSEEGEGSCFKIYLPAAERLAPHPAGDAACGPGDARILLTEDEPETCRLVTRILESSGYTVVTARSAEEAITLFKDSSEPFELLFSDIILPGKTGLQLADLLKQQSPRLHVLLYSGYRDHRDRWENLEQQGFHFLQKPFTIASLLTAVNETLNDITA